MGSGIEVMWTRFRREPLWLTILSCMLTVAWAQPQQGVVATKFRVAPDFYPPPNERQIKFLLEGASAQPESGGRYLVTEAQLTTFLKTSQPDMVIRTPRCKYDSNRRSVESDAALQVRTADGKFSIEGDGFLWLQTNSSLLISNNVRTVVQADLLQAGTRTNAPSDEPPLNIRSRQFQFNSEKGFGSYEGDVSVTGTNLDLTCGRLLIEVPFAGQTYPAFSSTAVGSNTAVVSSPGGLRQNKVRTITADKDVVVDYEGVHATGQHANYSVEKLLLNVTGRPAWQTGFREGRADEITIDRSNRVFRAENNAYLRLWGPELRNSALFGSLPGTTTNVVSTNRQVEITSGSYEIRTNAAQFRKDVVVLEGSLDSASGNQKPGQITCNFLDLELAGTNELRSATAEGNVAIQQANAQLTGDKAMFNAPAKLLSVTGAPAWKSGERKGAGDVILVDSGREEMRVRGNAWLETPAREMALGAGSASGTRTNSARISSSEYLLAKGRASFVGEVNVAHPQMRWACPTLTLDLPEQGGWVNRIVAEPSVRFDVFDSKGQQLCGTGTRAVYTRQATSVVTNSILELTGTPATLQTTNGMTLHNRVLLIDLGNNRFIVPPGYHILGPTNNSAATNWFKRSRSQLFR